MEGETPRRLLELLALISEESIIINLLLSQLARQVLNCGAPELLRVAVAAISLCTEHKVVEYLLLLLGAVTTGVLPILIKVKLDVRRCHRVQRFRESGGLVLRLLLLLLRLLFCGGLEGFGKREDALESISTSQELRTSQSGRLGVNLLIFAFLMRNLIKNGFFLVLLISNGCFQSVNLIPYYLIIRLKSLTIFKVVQRFLFLTQHFLGLRSDQISLHDVLVVTVLPTL